MLLEIEDRDRYNFVKFNSRRLQLYDDTSRLDSGESLFFPLPRISVRLEMISVQIKRFPLIDQKNRCISMKSSCIKFISAVNARERKDVVFISLCRRCIKILDQRSAIVELDAIILPFV